MLTNPAGIRMSLIQGSLRDVVVYCPLQGCTSVCVLGVEVAEGELMGAYKKRGEPETKGGRGYSVEPRATSQPK